MVRQAKILVVDDERGIREGCRRILLSEGHVVEAAASAEEALEKLEADGFDLALIDLKMPGMSGMELLERIHEHDPEIVCVMMTGYASLETAVEAAKKGIYDYIPKPFNPDELLVVLRKAMEKRVLSLEAQRLRQERERSLLEIAQEKGRLRAVIQCMVDGVLVTNRDGQLVLYNPAAVRMLHFQDAPAIGTPIAECRLPEQLVPLILCPYGSESDRCAMLSQEIAAGESVLMANVAAIPDESGAAIGSVVVLRDITALKELDRLKNQFVSLVSHELRAPVAAIEGYLEVVLTNAAGDDPEQKRQMLERAKERASGLLTLIRDLLDVSRIEARSGNRRLERVSLGEVLRSTVEFLGPQAKESGLRVEAAIPDSLPPVNADREELDRLFTNLVSNAIKYNRPNGTIRVEAVADGGYVRASVTDTGIGIPEEAIPHLFEEFYRVNSPQTRRITGTGLGLSIVRKIAEAHHGWVEVKSKEGEGSVFTVHLPIAEEGSR